MLTFNGLLNRLLDVVLILAGAALAYDVRFGGFAPTGSTAIIASSAAFSAAVSPALFPALGVYQAKPSRSPKSLAGQILFVWFATQICSLLVKLSLHRVDLISRLWFAYWTAATAVALLTSRAIAYVVLERTRYAHWNLRRVAIAGNGEHCDALKLGGKKLVSRWYSNAIFSGAKHVDVIIAAMLLGPAGAALYRGAKSVHNVAFNLGQALALVIHSRIHAWFSESTKRLSVLSAFAFGTAGIALLGLATLCAYKIGLFPTASLGTPSIQCLFLLLIFTGAALMFACRITSLVVFSISKRSFVILSTMEVAGSLSLLSGLCVAFGVVGAALSVAVSCRCVLVSSLMVVRRSFSVDTVH
ncbi:hypothetical protein [Caballeronia mineralivorans]|uniref:hypothetical protein n=1 Tax=Caballeronia mineralivorans TaxID=2010198 RepID=UPI002AFE9EC1|nr:hypothetical protein [Caballeronia mineralivorans]MEA3102435.1 hypothetical protein [Caballeronia mineralivorans]